MKTRNANTARKQQANIKRQCLEKEMTRRLWIEKYGNSDGFNSEYTNRKKEHLIKNGNLIEFKFVIE